MRVLFVVLVSICFFLTATSIAYTRIEKDLDDNGQIDQVLVYTDAGIILRVETDIDHDGFLEKSLGFTKNK